MSWHSLVLALPFKLQLKCSTYIYSKVTRIFQLFNVLLAQPFRALFLLQPLRILPPIPSLLEATAQEALHHIADEAPRILAKTIEKAEGC